MQNWLLQVRRAVSLVVAIFFFSASPAAWAKSTARPNIILILADDMGFSDLGCYGSEISTPNIDRLAAGGLRFTQFYNTARCCPTRASLMTGLYPHQAGVGHMAEHDGKKLADIGLPGYRGELNEHCVTIAQVLRSAGYHTAMSGKWHVTPVTNDKHNWPLQRGFEKYFGIIHGGASYFDPNNEIVLGNEVIQPDKKNWYLTDEIAKNAMNFLENFSKEKNPFFIYVAFTAPHWPLHALPEDIAKYKNKYGNDWEKFREARYKKQIELGIIDPRWPITPRDVQPSKWNDAKFAEWQGSRMAVFAAQIDRLDQNVGKILAKLKETGAEENTLVFFLSDNGGCAEHLGPGIRGPYVPEKNPSGGPMRKGNSPDIIPGAPDTYASYGQPWANVSNTPFRLYKHWVHEGGISTPLICSWPNVIKQHGTLTKQTGHVIDLMATCADVAGAKYPKKFGGEKITPLEGQSLLPILQGKQRKPHDAIFWEHEGNRAVRAGKWKLVSRHPDQWELFDMEADRTELNNLAAQNPAKAKELLAIYEAWAKRAGVAPWEEVQKKFREK